MLGLLYRLGGGVLIGASGKEHTVGSQAVALMHREGSILRLTATEPDTQVIVLGGEPLDQPIKAYGPFVD